jgi:hypothetical protein
VHVSTDLYRLTQLKASFGSHAVTVEQGVCWKGDLMFFEFILTRSYVHQKHMLTREEAQTGGFSGMM